MDGYNFREPRVCPECKDTKLWGSELEDFRLCVQCDPTGKTRVGGEDCPHCDGTGKLRIGPARSPKDGR